MCLNVEFNVIYLTYLVLYIDIVFIIFCIKLIEIFGKGRVERY